MLVFSPGGLGLRPYIFKYLLFRDYTVLGAIPLAWSQFSKVHNNEGAW